MKVKIKTQDFRFWMPVPAAMIGFVVKLIPDRIFDEIKTNTPEPYCKLITKEYVSMILNECLDIMKENKGLEVIHVNTADGTFISVKL